MEKYILPNNRILVINADDYPENPRSWDNLGTMACFHNRYNLGDNNIPFSSDEFDSWKEMEDYIINKLDAAVVLPMYMYDHSGITINTTGFSCPWDSGQIGFIYVTKEKLRKDYNVKRITKDLLDKATRCLLSEVATYDQYVTGDVYRFEILKQEVCDKECTHEEVEDSCSGFYGSDIKENGILDHICEEDLKAVLEQL